MLLSFESMPELAAALEATYRAELIQRAAAEITRLRRRLSQRKLEVALDLSQGYLSRLLAGNGVPSGPLVSLLALLGEEPARLEELKRYWALPVATPPRARKRKSGA
jgi:transcriptional regulator with XRE-family HTH domain